LQNLWTGKLNLTTALEILRQHCDRLFEQIEQVKTLCKEASEGGHTTTADGYSMEAQEFQARFDRFVAWAELLNMVAE
jgi:cytochrome c556